MSQSLGHSQKQLIIILKLHKTTYATLFPSSQMFLKVVLYNEYRQKYISISSSSWLFFFSQKINGRGVINQKIHLQYTLLVLHNI